MSQLIKRLDEIKERLAAMQPDGHEPRWSADPLVPCPGCLRLTRAHEAVKYHAAADLAYLARLLRMVAEAGCDGANEGVDDDGWTCAVSDVDPSDWCLPCRIRRAGEVGP